MFGVEQTLVLADVVQQWKVLIKLFPVYAWVDVPIYNSKKDHRDACKDDVVELHIPLVKDSLATKTREVGEEVVWHCQGNVFVKKVVDERGYARVS